MKYIIMCGGIYVEWGKVSRWEVKIKDEPLVKRTIRLLREAGVEDIAISSLDPKMKKYGVPVLKHDYIYRTDDPSTFWGDGFYPMTEPVCYIYGDVYFSPEAIQTIVNFTTDGIMFFASVAPFDPRYIKNWAEPFAFKVVDTEHFRNSLRMMKEYHEKHMFNRHPCSWELWQVIKNTPLNDIRSNYCGISDYSCDIDYPEDIERLEARL